MTNNRLDNRALSVSPPSALKLIPFKCDKSMNSTIFQWHLCTSLFNGIVFYKGKSGCRPKTKNMKQHETHANNNDDRMA